MTHRMLCLLAGAALSGCGVASISPLVSDADIAFDQRLVGTWEDSSADEAAVVTAAGSSYQIVYKDDKGKTDRYIAKLGRLGSYRLLDLQPDVPLPDASDFYKKLVLRTHAILVIDSLGTTLHFRMLEVDSVKAYLARRPQAVRHAIVENDILLTGSTMEARTFLREVIGATGFLSDPEVWRRRVR